MPSRDCFVVASVQEIVEDTLVLDDQGTIDGFQVIVPVLEVLVFQRFSHVILQQFRGDVAPVEQC